MAILASSTQANKRFEAVLFDWMLTLAHYSTLEDHLALALVRLGREASSDRVADLADRLRASAKIPRVLEASAVEDTSQAAHHHSEHLLYSEAGIDKELADSLYSFLGTPAFHPLYPDVARTLERLRKGGLHVGVVSDIHTDLRQHAEAFGIAANIDAWSLSWEQGIQKPDLGMFQTAIDQLSCDPARTVMVGDRGVVDGAAVALGVTCLILPEIDRTRTPLPDRGLATVLDLVGVA